MRKYIAKRILISIAILFFVMFIIYTLMRCLPTSYIEAMARQKSMQPNSKSYEEWMAQLAGSYNLDKGIIPGFFGWLGREEESGLCRACGGHPREQSGEERLCPSLLRL